MFVHVSHVSLVDMVGLYLWQIQFGPAMLICGSVLVCEYLVCNSTPLEVKLICFLLVGFKAFPRFCAVPTSPSITG